MTQNQYWNEKIVLITGGSSGIGLAAAKQLASAGAQVWLAARRRELLEVALKELQAARRNHPSSAVLSPRMSRTRSRPPRSSKL